MSHKLKSFRKSKYPLEVKHRALELRRLRGFSFGMVAKELGIPYETIKNWLNGVECEVPKERQIRCPYPVSDTPFEKLKGKFARKNFLIRERGRKCEECGLHDWLEKPISLELHHVDGVQENWSQDNLLLLCPNCHSFTDTYRGKNTDRHRRKLRA